MTSPSEVEGMTLNTKLETRLVCGDALEEMRTIPTGSVDLICTDPPYGIGIDSWDKPVPLAEVFAEFRRVLNPDGFLAFFGQMPTMCEWNMEARRHFRYREHIVWVKRNTAPQCRLFRSHESVFVYSLHNAKFFQQKGPFEDVRLPGVLVDVASLESVRKHMTQLRTGERGPKVVAAAAAANGAFARYTRMKCKRSADGMVNYTNVWSFFPTKAKVGPHYHPTEKPLLLMQRLIEMLSAPRALVLDPYCGSGSTVIAAFKAHRRVIGVDIRQECIRHCLARIDHPSGMR